VVVGGGSGGGGRGRGGEYVITTREARFWSSSRSQARQRGKQFQVPILKVHCVWRSPLVDMMERCAFEVLYWVTGFA
jgi:hypothetical protein